MKRSIVTLSLAEGIWRGLECGHPSPARDQTSGVVQCRPCDLRQIPSTTMPGRQTPVFDRTTVPSALLRAHKTNAWAELVVLEGQVDFYDEDPFWFRTATPEHGVVIVPKRAHRVEPSAEARFYVQFHDLPKSAPETAQ